MGMSAKYTFVFVNSSEEVSYSFRVNDPSTVSRLVMSPHGQLTMFDWSDESRQWLLHWATPTSQCDVYACGPFGLCDSSQYCRCLPRLRARVARGLGRPALERRLREEDELAMQRGRVIDRWVPPGAKRPAAERLFPGG
ncbi:hypothetical protein C2845_PM01G10100 [Panicum miliaceum]|uniref:S-locus glycoprotein domain-containing protein n=1 Tax=Panicum miliaceum TaxID=4540 RepID=A0A3L6TW92_PANMI|nr:hypothetical protein C2845_PM01G10100 [Panicum miliaceum]